MSAEKDLVPVQVTEGSTVIDRGRRLQAGDTLRVPMAFLAPMVRGGFVTLPDLDQASA